MEKAILKTVIYANFFDYPLKAYEIHKWLISKEATLRGVEKALQKLTNRKIKKKNDYFFLKKRDSLIKKRQLRELQSKKYFLKAKIFTWFLKIIPFIKLIGISGGLALNNASKNDDIDLFLITSKNRVWSTRILAILILDFLGVRRKVSMNSKQASGKLCLNILIAEDKLTQENKDLYIAHEVLQMKPLWYQDGIYQKYLQDNEWVFKYLPNWVGEQSQKSNSPSGARSQKYNSKLKIIDEVEKLAKWIQLKIMKKPQGMERIKDGALYFHPQDVRDKVLTEYKQRTKKLSNP